MNNNTQSWLIPSAIVFGFALIAVAIYLTADSRRSPAPAPINQVSQTSPSVPIKPVDDTDYIKGNPNAPILIVTYSDYDCPFCKTFHTTMTDIMDEYAVTGKIAWVYRQFPLVDIHPMSGHISLNALCVGKLGGNNAFWKFTDNIFTSRDLDEPTNITLLPGYAEEAGVSRNDLVRCLSSKTEEPTLTASLKEGAAAGLEGTPHSFIIVGNQIEPIGGAGSYSFMKTVIEEVLNQLEGPATTTAAATL